MHMHTFGGITLSRLFPFCSVHACRLALVQHGAWSFGSVLEQSQSTSIYLFSKGGIKKEDCVFYQRVQFLAAVPPLLLASDVHQPDGVASSSEIRFRRRDRCWISKSKNKEHNTEYTVQTARVVVGRRVPTLNAVHRKQELQKIAEENQALLKRIQAVCTLPFASISTASSVERAVSVVATELCIFLGWQRFPKGG